MRLLVCLLLVAVPLHAPGEEVPESPGLDLLLLVDRSRSMSGDRAVPNVALSLALDAVARAGEASHVCHRFGIVSFGTTAHVDVPLTSVCRKDHVARLRDAVERLSTTGSGMTDALAAFRTAETLFDVLPRDESRRRAIVLLTDGLVYVRGMNRPAYERELRAAAMRMTTGIDIVLFPSPEARGLPLWRDVSRGRVHEAGSASSDIAAVTHDVIATLTGTRHAEATDGLVVPPYLDVIVFDVLRPSRDVDVAVFAPGASDAITEHSASVQRVRAGGALTTIIVQRPVPGRWRFRTSHAGAEVRILSEEFFPRGTLLMPPPTPPVRQRDRFRPTYSVLDADGLPLKPLTQHPLSLELLLRVPDGTEIKLPMASMKQSGRATFESLEEAACNVPGRYWTEVVVRTIDSERRRVDVFRDRWSGFTVVGPPATRSPRGARASIAVPLMPRPVQLKRSVAEVIGLPDDFRTALLVIAFLLALAPYLAGATIGSLHVPTLGARKRRLMRIAGPFAILGAIALGLPLATLARPVTPLELLAVDVTENAEIDIAIANRGSSDALLTRIELQVVKDYHRTARPALVPTATYRMGLHDLPAGQTRALIVRHAIAANTTERIVLAAETNRALDVRVHIHAANGSVLTVDAQLPGPAM